MIADAHADEDLGGIIFVHHPLFFLPHIELVLPDTEQDGNVFPCHDVTFSEDSILGYPLDDLCDIMAEHCAFRVDCFN